MVDGSVTSVMIGGRGRGRSGDLRGDRRGANLGSSKLDFEPNNVRAGDYDFDVRSAGSATLVLQTVLPALLAAGASSTLRLSGGTHNAWAPPFDFLERVSICR